MTAQERGRKFRLLNKVKIAAKCRDKRKAAREAAALAGTPMLKPGQNHSNNRDFLRKCNCGECPLCTRRAVNANWRLNKRLGIPQKKYITAIVLGIKYTKVARTTEEDLKLRKELARMDREAEFSLDRMRTFRQHEPLLQQSSPLA